MKRRRFLALCGVGTAGALAGCGEDARPSVPAQRLTTVAGPAKFGDVIIQTDGSADVDSPVTVTVSAYNYGGETGTFTDRLVSVDGGIDLATDVRIADVPSGERGHTSIETSFENAGRYRFHLEEADVYGTVNVAGETAELGEALRVGPFEVTLSEVTYEPNLFYRYRVGSRDVTELVGATPNEALAVVRGTVENVGTQQAVFDPSVLSVQNGEVLADAGGENLSTVRVDGRPVVGQRLPPGESMKGWLLLRLDRSRARAGPSLGWQADGNPDSAPEKQWALPAADPFPEFELVAFDVPGSQSVGRVPYEVRVHNSGDVAGTYRGAIHYRTDGWGWQPAGVQEAYLEPGASRTFTGRTRWPYVDPATWRVVPFHEKRDVTFEPLSVPFGEKVPIADASTVRVRNPRFIDSYVYEVTVVETPEQPVYGANNTTGSTEPVERTERRVRTPRDAGDGKFLLVDIETRAGSDGGRIAQEDAFSVLVGGRTFDVDQAHQPVAPDVEFFDAGEDTRYGELFRGTLMFGVPSGARLSDVAVRYREEYEDVAVEATWQG